MPIVPARTRDSQSTLRHVILCQVCVSMHVCVSYHNDERGGAYKAPDEVGVQSQPAPKGTKKKQERKEWESVKRTREKHITHEKQSEEEQERRDAQGLKTCFSLRWMWGSKGYTSEDRTCIMVIHTHTHTHKEVKITHTLHDIQYIKCWKREDKRNWVGWKCERDGEWWGRCGRVKETDFTRTLKHTSHTEGETARDEHLW